MVFIGGLSWEGFVFFLFAVHGVSVYEIATKEASVGSMKRYALWVSSWVPLLYLVSPAYRQSAGWATHLFAVGLLPPVGLLGILCLRCLLRHFSPSLGRHDRKFGLCLVGVCVLCGVLYLLRGVGSFSTTAFPFADSRLLSSIGELAAPPFGYWVYRYGSVFLTGSLGLSLMPVLRWGRAGRPLAVCLSGFCVSVFCRQPLGTIFGGAAIPDALFLIATCSVGLTFAHLLWQQTAAPPRADRGVALDVALLIWGVLWLGLARDAKRFDFFIGLPLAYFTARLLEAIATQGVKVLSNPKWTTDALRARLKGQPLRGMFTGVLVCGVCLWSPFPGEGGHLWRSAAAGRHMRGPDPGEGPLIDAYTWIRASLPAESVVAAEWSYGTQLNVFGGVRTVVDPDHYLPYWIALYHRHVIHAKNEPEVLAFLLTHDATHLLTPAEKHPSETLFGKGGLSSAFRPLYPAVGFATSPVKLYELAYPEALDKRPEYLYRAPGVPLSSVFGK